MTFRKIIWLTAVLAVLTGCAAPAVQVPSETVAVETTQPTQIQDPVTVPTTAPTEPPEEHFQLTFTGDCTFGSSPANYYADFSFINVVGEDYGFPFRNVISWFEGDECSFINLEGPLTDSGYPQEKKHTFSGPTAYGQILTENSIDAVTIANNHTMDYGKVGYESTLATLEGIGIPFVERDCSCVFETEHGLEIGMYAAVYYLLDPEVITREIAALKQQGCDLVIFAPHWGTEGTYRPTQAQVDLAHAVIDAGADIVWGSHPHVLQPIERYGSGIIFYSLGNFSFGGNGCPRDFDTAFVQQEIIRAADGTISLGELTIVPASISSITQWNNFQPTPCEEGSEMYQRVMQKLDGTWTGPNLPIQ